MTRLPGGRVMLRDALSRAGPTGRAQTWPEGPNPAG